MAKKKYTEEFKADAIKLAREARRGEKSAHEVARDLGVHPNTLADWIRRDDSLHAGDGINTDGLYDVQLVKISETTEAKTFDFELLSDAHRILDMDMIEPTFDATVFTKNRERLLAHDVAGEFFRAVVAQAEGEADEQRALHRRWHAHRGDLAARKVIQTPLGN